MSGLARIEVGEGNKTCDFVRVTDRNGIATSLLATDISGSPEGTNPSWVRFGNKIQEVTVFEDGRSETRDVVIQSPQQPSGQRAA